jgi:myo-inositol-1(or 4)-monophosphatase
MSNYAEWLAAARSIVERSGDIVRGNNLKPRNIRHKGRIDLVTDTDVAVEEFLKEELLKAFPTSRFLAEESAGDAGLQDMTWVIDPVDGTTNFAHGLPFVATSVALWHQGQVVLGVVNLPLMNELFAASLGGGTTLNGKPVTVSSAEMIEESLFATGFPYAIGEHLEGILERLRRLLPLVRGVRRPGAAALDLAYVACGRYDAFYEEALNPWDTAAGMLLVTEAGGRVSRVDTESYRPGDPDILATNGTIHEKASELLVL